MSVVFVCGCAQVWTQAHTVGDTAIEVTCGHSPGIKYRVRRVED